MSETLGFDARDRSTFHFHATPLRRGALWLLRRIVRPVMRLDVQGLHNVPAEGGMILASNHVSNFDVFPMQLAMPRPIFFMGKAELFQFAPLAALLRDFGAFPVYRGEKDAWALRHARRVLDNGQTLGMFPEGTRSRGRGLGIAKTGTAKLAIEAQCPILPMAVTGTDRFFKSFPRRTPVRVIFLPPITPVHDDDPSELTDRLMFALAAALPEPMRGAYADPSSPPGVPDARDAKRSVFT